MTAVDTQMLRLEIEDFLYREADLVDLRQFEDWLALFSDDLHYHMPIVRNLAVRDIGKEYLTEPLDVAWFDEDKATLATRVAQIRTGVHWAEEPLSRTAHFVSNVRIVSVDDGDPQTVTVRSKFMIYRNRNEDEEDKVFGSREDVLRRHGDTWQICRRRLFINQSVLLSSSLSYLV